MTARLHLRVLVVLVIVVLSAGAWTAPAADCDGNGLDDACDLECGDPGGSCDVPGCGAATDCDGNAVPDGCDVAANGAGCRYTDLLASNSTASPDSNLVGPPDDLFYGLGGQQVTYRFVCGLVVDGAGPDFNVYELDNGAAEFASIDVLVSANGVDFVSVGASIGAKVDIDGDEAHGSATFARAFDLAGSGLSAVRYIRIDGDGSGASGPSTGFDLDAIGVINRLGLDCDADGALDACESPADCDGDGAPDACALASGIVSDCNANGVPDRCDAGSTSSDCDGNDRPDECQADCNASGRPDACDIADSSSPDCNTNAVPDECDLALAGTVTALSERLRPFGNGFPVSWTIRSAFPARGPVVLTVAAASDLDAADESVHVELNGVPVGRVFESGGAHCGAAVGTLTIDPVTFNDTVANGDAVFRFVATSAVNKEDCPESWVEAGVSYDASVDCDSNGVLDHCQIDAAAGLDLNHNGLLDACEPDCNENGQPDDYDVETGSSPDCNANGAPDECDVSGGAGADCDANGVPDECQPDCNANGVADPCDISGGASPDCDASGVPDECELAAADASCPFPLQLAQNTTGADASRFLGPPDDVSWGLGGQVVTYEWTCGRIVDGPGADITVYEIDSGEVEFAAVGVLVSDDGVAFHDITASMVAGVRTAGDGAHGAITFRRSYDLAWAGVRGARFVRLDGAGTGAAGSNTGFDLDAVGALHLVDRDCDESGALDSCEALADCDTDGLPDVCQVAAVGGSDCTGNAVPDACDIAGGAADCDADGVPDACGPDCNGNGAADDCEIAAATSPDCNGNSRPDECDLAVVAVAEQSMPLAPIGSGYAQSLTLRGPPAATGAVVVTVAARGDFDATNESLAVTLNGTSLGNVFDTASAFCTEISDSVELTASGYNVLVLSGDATLTVSATSTVGAFECEGSYVTMAISYAAQPDCDGNMVPDACDVASGTASDCNRDGVLDACDIAGGTSGDCNSDGRPDECPLCPPVKVVFVMDTSTSMTDEGAALCASISAVAVQLESELVDVETELLGIMAPGTGQFACLTDSVAGLYGTGVPRDPPPNNEILGACPGGNEVGAEDWGRATSVVAGNKPWPTESVRLVIPVSDEGPWCGDPVTDPGVDRDSIKHAIQTSVADGVIVSPITGTGTSSAMRAMAQNLADATGGEVFSSQLPEDDLAAGIMGIIRSACRRSTDCNLNDRPDECDLADGTSQDCDADQRPDECEADCNGNARNDTCDIREGTSQDGNGNGIPDECEGVQLTLGETNLAWTEAYAAIGYDVVRGSLIVLRDTRGDFTAAVDSCVVNDSTATSWPHGADPATGAGFWYLVRAELGSGPLTYDAPGSGQAGSRDAEIEASPNACP